MMRIQTGPLKPAVTIQVPGSKSYTHRLLIAAALANGPCRIGNPLHSEDTLLTLGALHRMGIRTDADGGDILVHGGSGRLGPCQGEIDLGNSGTSMRLLSGLAILGQGEYCFTGSSRMQQRPIQALLDSLRQLGVDVRSRNNDGCPPVIIPGGIPPGRRTTIDCSTSSQYLSALLLAAPCLPHGLVIDVLKGPVSQPYIDMTLSIMDLYRIVLRRDGYIHFEIPGRQVYQAGDHVVEPDASQAGYFWAAAAITGTRVKVRGITPSSCQGDVGLADVFARMGCRVSHESDGTVVAGADLNAVTVDMGDMPDMVPTLAVVAAFARGTTIVRNVAHLRAKESDRLAAVSHELARMGIRTECGPDELHIHGGVPKAAEIHTYSDHRIAMSFAVAGLKVPGVRIADPICVAKSFPNFWEVFGGLYQRRSAS